MRQYYYIMVLTLNLFKLIYCEQILTIEVFIRSIICKGQLIQLKGQNNFSAIIYSILILTSKVFTKTNLRHLSKGKLIIAQEHQATVNLFTVHNSIEDSLFNSFQTILTKTNCYFYLLSNLFAKIDILNIHRTYIKLKYPYIRVLGSHLSYMVEMYTRFSIQIPVTTGAEISKLFGMLRAFAVY